MVQREVGVQTAPCHSCGKALPATERPDGSLAAVACGCSGAQPVELAVAATVVLDPPNFPGFQLREHGVDPVVDENELDEEVED